MKSTLTAAHLLRHFLLFVMTVIFLLTMIRSAYALWHFPKLEETNAFVELFVQGLRFDLALIGIVCFIPVVLGSLLSMTKVTRPLAKFIINLFLFGGLFLILLLELVTPWFIDTQGIRPDLALLQAVETPVATIQGLVSEHLIPVIIGSVLSLLILIAFWSRLEIRRFLRYRMSVSGALFTCIVGGLLCVLAIWSTPDLRKPAFSPADAQISDNQTINDISMNTTYKTLHAELLPLLNR